MKELIEDSEKIDIHRVIGTRLREIEEKRMQLAELKDTFTANRSRLTNLQEMEDIIQNY